MRTFPVVLLGLCLSLLMRVHGKPAPWQIGEFRQLPSSSTAGILSGLGAFLLPTQLWCQDRGETSGRHLDAAILRLPNS